MAVLRRAVTHIRLSDTNASKLAQLDALGDEYLRVTQAYAHRFCNDEQPNGNGPLDEATTLPCDWHRCARRHAAAIATSWLSNRTRLQREYHQRHARWQHAPDDRPEPTWHDPDLPTLRLPSLRANSHVAVLEPAKDATFPFWLRISTLVRRQRLVLPIQLAAYHRRMLALGTLASDLTLARDRKGVWWLTLVVKQEVAEQPITETVGVDAGIVSFLTDSDGAHYGTFSPRLRRLLARDREKQTRKAKLRACLKAKGVPAHKLPSVRSGKLSRRVRQAINRAVNQLYAAHPTARIAYEDLDAAGMRNKGKRMNVLLTASQIGHIPRQLAWGAMKRGLPTVPIVPAYSSQTCPRCWYVDRANRPRQQTFCCRACGYAAPADDNAAENIRTWVDDPELAFLADRPARKQLLLLRHATWKLSSQAGLVAQPPAQARRLADANRAQVNNIAV